MSEAPIHTRIGAFFYGGDNMSLLGNIYDKVKEITVLVGGSSDSTDIPIYKYLTNLETKNAKVDYSSTPTSYKYTADSSRVDMLERLNIYYSDSGSFDSGGFGNGSALTNGIVVNAQINGILYTYTDGIPIKTNGFWNTLAGVDVRHEKYGAGDEYISVRFTMARSGQPAILDGSKGDYFEVVLNDNFSVLTNFYMMVQGRGVSK